MSTLRRRIVALLAIPLLLVLSACKMHMEFVILDETRMQVNMDMSMDETQADAMDMTSQDLCALSEQDLQEEDVDLTSTPYTADGQVGCWVSMTGPLEDTDGTVVLEDDVWTFTMPADTLQDQADTTGMENIDMQVMVTFPGEVLTHSGNSVVEGTTVIWSDPADLQGGTDLTATGRNAGAAPQPRVTPPGDVAAPQVTPTQEEPAQEEDATPAETPIAPEETTVEATPQEAETAAGETEEEVATEEATTPEGTEATVDDDEGGFPVWGWVLVGAIVLGAVAAAIAVARRNKGDDAGGPGAAGRGDNGTDWAKTPLGGQHYSGQDHHPATPLYPGQAGYQEGYQAHGGYPPPPPQSHPLEGTPHEPPGQREPRAHGPYPGQGPRPPAYPGAQPEQYLGHGQPHHFPGQGGLDSATGQPPGRVDAPTEQFPGQGHQPGGSRPQQYPGRTEGPGYRPEQGPGAAGHPGSDEPTQEFPRSQETPNNPR